MSQLEVLYEDNHLLAVMKPAGLATMGLADERETLLSRAKSYVKRAYQKPGNVYLGVVSRLDAPVTGVVLLARTSKAARRLNEQFRSRQVTKTYWALVDGSPEPKEARLVHYLRKDDRHRKMHTTHESHVDAQRAELSYRSLAQVKSVTQLEIDLYTGRKHQIRVQLAKIGTPVLGDRKYGSRCPFPHGIALHARQLTVAHPVRKSPLTIVAPLPPSWRKYGFPGA